MKKTHDIICSRLKNYRQGTETPLGLFNGNAGIAIICYILGKQQQDTEIEKIGTELLNEISDNIAKTDHIGFDEGLLGIGWAIEWLAQHDLLDVDTNEILDEVDDTIYKLVVYKLDNGLSLSTGILGKLSYFLKRTSSRNAKTHRYRHICHQECIVILTDNLENLLRGEKEVFNELSLEELLANKSNLLSEIGTTIRLLADVIRINEPTVRNIVFGSFTFIDALFLKLTADKESFLKINSTLFYKFFDLSINYYIASKKMKNLSGEYKAIEYIQFLNKKNNQFRECDDTLPLLRVFSLLNIHFPDSGYDLALKEAITATSPEKLPFNFYQGIGTFFLAELSLRSPGFVKQWDELFFI